MIKLWKYTLAPLALMLLCPILVVFLWYTAVHLEGSVEQLASLLVSQGFFTTLFVIWEPIFFGSPIAWKMIGVFIALQLLFMRVLPGKAQSWNPTSNQADTSYKANGFFCYSLTLLLFYLTSFQWQLFAPTLIYDHFGEIIGSLNLLSLILCLFLFMKGRFLSPSFDAKTSSNAIFDFYWGTELYPRIKGWDVKVFTNCRFGLISWSILLLSFLAKQKELHGYVSNALLVSVILQLLYITKFFIWEKGYMKSLDMLYGRAGYYLCWGCLVWLPVVYSSTALFLVQHPTHLPSFLAWLFLGLGSGSIFVNYLADRQRELFRETKGECFIWKKKPRIIIASHITKEGESRQSLLLASGWWGIARHFHYFPEFLGAFFWSIPALFNHYLPYFYLTFLGLLLINRMIRHDKRCQDKYGQDWDLYCEHVPYKIIPFVY